MKKFLIIAACIMLILAAAATVLAGALGGLGPFGFIQEKHIASLTGNSEQYSFEQLELLKGNPLEGKNICVLGSSVVFGAASQENSVAEYFGKRFGCTYTKEAVSGTTLVDNGKRSYVQRLQTLDKNAHYDLFICQLSTNDATMKKPLGEISNDGTFDTSTVTGAMEFIINYARETWQCPVVFFTGSRYDSERYSAMVERLMELKEKYGIGVLDLWHGEEFNSISDSDRAIYMNDNIHPTKAGYRDWWGPELEKQLLEYLKASDK